MGGHSELSAKSRNDRRAVVRQFLKWCVRKDYLAASHRLLEADGLVKEALEGAQIGYFRPNELGSLLKNADRQMRVVIAIQGLAGLRLEEVLRLDWEDVFRIRGHIEVSSSKSKTRQRRLVVVCASLQEWLTPYRAKKGKLATQWDTVNQYVQDFSALRESLKIPARRNGLRHAFCTFHFALHSNENLTAAQAGNSPAMIHKHYKALATKADGKRWFNVRPAKAAANVVPLLKQDAA
jgi:integrase